MRRLRLPASPVEHSLEARAFVFSGLAVAVLAVALYGQDYVLPVIALAVAAAGHVVSYRERNGKRGVRRQILLAALLFVALFYFVTDSELALFGGVMPQANFAILLIAITSFDLKSRRNCYSSLWISLALVYLAAVFAWDYSFGLLLALWAVCLAGFWTASHLRRMGADLAAPPFAVAASLAGAMLIGVAAFIVVPQPQGAPTAPLALSLPNFAQFQGGLEQPALPLVQLGADSSGATQTVDLHFRGRLGDAPVMYVRTAAPAYWRGLVFDTYRNGVWTASNAGYTEMPPFIAPRDLPPEPPNNLGTFVQVFRVVRPLPGVLDAAYPLESLYAPVSSLRLDAYGTFHAPQPLRPGQTYSAVSYLPNLSPQELRSDEYTPVPASDQNADLDARALSARGRALAAQVASGTTNEYDLVMAVTNHLQRTYRYTLQLPAVPAGRDPVDWFLFDVKTGYCEQFATAETLMLRSLGIPARLVTGYGPGEYDSVLNQAVVRERDAHAWVEVWFAGHGWVPVDPTPGVDPLAVTRYPSHWAAAGLARLLPHVSFGVPAAALGSVGPLAAIPVAVALVVAAALLVAWLRRRRPRRSAKAAPGEGELLALYERLQRRAGRRRAPPETPLEYLRGTAPGSLESLLEDVTEAVNQGAYAGRWPEPKRVREMADRLS